MTQKVNPNKVIHPNFTPSGNPHISLLVSKNIFNSNIVLSEGVFAHIHGDQFIQKTGLEGETALNLLRTWEHYTEDYIKRFGEDSDLRTLLRLLTGARECEERITPSSYKGTLRNHIQTLKKGESFLFPVGWNSEEKGNGHALYMLVTKQANGTFSIKIYNKGGGVNEYHPSIVQGLRCNCHRG